MLIILFSLLFFPLSADIQLRLMALDSNWLAAKENESKKDPWKTQKQVDDHRQRIAGIISSLEPDLVVMTKSLSKESVDKLIQILHRKGLKSYRYFHKESQDKNTNQDITLITRFIPDPINHQFIHSFYSKDLKGFWRQKYLWEDNSGNTYEKSTSIRKNALFYFTLYGKKIALLGLHLKENPNRKKTNAQREAQALLVQKIIQEQIDSKGYLPIVLGNFNDFDSDIPDKSSSVSKTRTLSLIKNYDSSTSSPTLLNAMEWIPSIEDRYTSYFDANKNQIIDKKDLWTSTEHILIHKNLEKYIHRVFIDHGHSTSTSNHWPIIVDFRFD